MSKKGGGLLALLTGMAAGAAAMFLSDKKNLAMTKRKLKAAGTTAKKLKQELATNPSKTIKKLQAGSQKLAKKALSSKTTRHRSTRKKS